VSLPHAASCAAPRRRTPRVPKPISRGRVSAAFFRAAGCSVSSLNRARAKSQSQSPIALRPIVAVSYAVEGRRHPSGLDGKLRPPQRGRASLYLCHRCCFCRHRGPLPPLGLDGKLRPPQRGRASLCLRHRCCFCRRPRWKIATPSKREPLVSHPPTSRSCRES
jgi:hypothetical protein